MNFSPSPTSTTLQLVDSLASWLSIAEFASRAGVSTKTVRRWIQAGRLHAVRMGPKLIRVNPAELSRLLELA
jgi:excisionase family DNA binding protein